MSVADELEIRALVARYADAVNARDEAAWAATWSDDGVWELMGQAPSGRDAVVAFWRTAMGFFESVIQQVSEGSIVLDGDTGTGRWTINEHGRTAKGDAMLMIGVYEDRYLRTADGWRFQHRKMSPLYQGPPDLSGTFTPSP